MRTRVDRAGRIHRSYVLEEAERPESATALVARMRSSLAAHRDELGATYEYAGVEGGTKSRVWKELGKERGSRIALSALERPRGRFVEVSAASEARCRRLGAALAKEFSFRTAAELADEAKRRGEEDPVAIELMAFAAVGRPDPRVRAVVEALLRSRSTKARNTAVMAVGLLLWPELLPALQAALAAESDAGTRTIARFLVAVMRDEAPSAEKAPRARKNAPRKRPSSRAAR